MRHHTAPLILALLVLLASAACDSPATPPEAKPQLDAGATPPASPPRTPSEAAKPPAANPTPTGEQAAAPQEDPPLDVSPLLALEDVRRITLYEGPLSPTSLQGIRPSRSYGSARLKPDDKADNFGVAVQLWKCTQAEAQERFDTFSKTFKDPRVTQEIGLKSLRSQRKHVLHLAWIVEGDWDVLTVTCDDRLCNEASLLALAQSVNARRAASRP